MSEAEKNDLQQEQQPNSNLVFAKIPSDRNLGLLEENLELVSLKTGLHILITYLVILVKTGNW